MLPSNVQCPTKPAGSGCAGVMNSRLRAYNLISSSNSVPVAPEPSTPMARLVTLWRLAPNDASSIFHACHARRRSAASPSYGTLEPLTFTYNCPVLPAVPWNHSPSVLTPCSVQFCGANVRVTSDRVAVVLLYPSGAD
ncbi:MAG: hypothetical protein ACYSWQ_01300 [Planctomycetota bacterium]